MTQPAPQQIWPEDFAARYRAEGYWQGRCMGDILRQSAAQTPDATAVTGPDGALSYAQLLEAATQKAHGLRALGLREGDRVVVQLPNLCAFLTASFGLFLAGLVPVFALPAHRETELAHFVERSGARGLICAARHEGYDYTPLALSLKSKLDHVVILGGSHPDLIAFEPLGADIPADIYAGPLPSPAPSSVALIQISGGSTGLSKLIPRSHDDYIYSFTASAPICGLSAASVYMATLPAAHNFPMSSPGVFGALAVGAKVVMCDSPRPETALALIAREKVTITGVVPPLALLWMQAQEARPYDLASLNVLQVGGAKLIPEVAARIRPSLGCQLQQVFGMAEGLVNYTRLDDPEETILHSQGRPISPADEVLILDDAGAPVPQGQAGHLLTRGPYTIRAYHAEPAANARAFTEDGFYRTGDIVAQRPDGNLTVQGRAGDHINRAGEKISAEEVEDHLLAHPEIFDAAVVSIPDPYLGERICAFLIARDPSAAPRGKDVKAFLRARAIAAFKIPDQIVFVPAFETTAVGKVSRKALRAKLRQSYLEENKA